MMVDWNALERETRDKTYIDNDNAKEKHVTVMYVNNYD